MHRLAYRDKEELILIIDLFGDVPVNKCLNVHRGEEGMKNELLKLFDNDT